MTRNVVPATTEEAAGLRETASSLYAVALLGSFMHAAARQEDIAELALGGLAALAPHRLVAVAWYPQGPERPMRVAGRHATGDGLVPGLAGPVARFCSQLPVSRPTRHSGGQLPGRLRVGGIQSLLAVPLRMSTECLGFLVIGGPEPCFGDDLAFVQALGAQVSTALYVGRLREWESNRVRELDALTDDLREQGDLLSRALTLQEGLLDLVLNGREAATIVEHLAAAMRAVVWLLDPAGAVIAHSVAAQTASDLAVLPAPADLGHALAQLRGQRDGRPVEISDGGPPALVQSVATDREVFGYLVVRAEPVGRLGDMLLQGGRLVLALRLLIERSVAEAEERAGRDLIQDALLLHRAGHTSTAVAAHLGYDRDGPVVVMAVRIPAPRDGEALRRRAEREVRSEVRSRTAGLVGLIGDDIVVVVRPEAAEGCGRRILERLGAALPQRRPGMGVSDPRPTLAELEPAYREAVTAAAVTERVGRDVLRFGDLGLYRLFFDAQHADRVEEFIERWLGPLLRYDTAHHTDLVETLAAQLAGAGRDEVAAKLCIHPSTLKYRLRRIREIFGVDFADAESRFNVELALRLVQVMGDMRAAGDPR